MNLLGPPRNLRPRYNIAPTAAIDAARPVDGDYELVPMRWGLAETRKDMRFVTSLRLGARKDGEKIFWWAVALLGTTALRIFWPDISKYIGR